VRGGRFRSHGRASVVVLVAIAAGVTGISTVSASTAGRSPDSVLSAGQRAGHVNVDKATIPQLQKGMSAGRFTAVELTRFYLQRIRRVNPKLHAVITTNPDAISEAAASDKRRRDHSLLGPLDGIAVLLKDNVDTHDRQGTTAGSLALAKSKPTADAFLVQRLRSADPARQKIRPIFSVVTTETKGPEPSTSSGISFDGG